jgi:hypothetical protein
LNNLKPVAIKHPPSKPVKKLLAEHSLPLDATTFNNGLILAGFMRIVKYESTSDSGEIKYYMELTEDGLRFGRNKPSGWHEFKTEPIFYEGSFSEVYCIAIVALTQHATQKFPEHIQASPHDAA